MIILNPTLQAALQAPVVEPFFLVKIGSYYTTNYYTDLTYDYTYIADGRLIGADPPKLSSTVDRELYKIVIADPTYSFGETLDDNLIGVNASVRIGFVDQATKAPYSGVSNTILIYKGLIESTGYDINTEDRGEAKLVVTCSSPLANLDEVQQLTTSKKALHYINGGDTSFDQVYEGSGGISLRWGKV
jgi:hypothetical protein